MPVLDIDLSNVNTDNLRMANHYLRAVMLYPENPVKRQRFIALRQGEEYAKILWHNPVEAHRQEFEWVTQLVHDLRHEKSQDFTKRFEHGLLVGGVLATIKQLDDHGYDASLSKARDVFARCREATEIIQCGFVASERTIRTVWQKYKPVAHLWAVFYLAKGKLLSDWRPIDASPEALLVFLARAEHFRHFGENHYPGYPADLQTALEPNATWTVADTITLPDGQVSLPSPPAWLTAAVTTYKPSKAKSRETS